MLRKYPGVRRVLTFGEDHPAHKYLRAFVECRRDCVGKEIDWPGLPGIDQDWYSEFDQCKWRFSAFTYMYVSFDPMCEEWLDDSDPPKMSPYERKMLSEFPRLERLMMECESAAIRDGNLKVAKMARQVYEMFGLWREAIRFRLHDYSM